MILALLGCGAPETPAPETPAPAVAPPDAAPAAAPPTETPPPAPRGELHPAVPDPLANGNHAPKADAGGPYTTFQFFHDAAHRPKDAPPVPAAAAVTFSAARSSDPDGDPLTYRWEFNDRGSATTMEATHWYTRPGLWMARLTVEDPHGARDVVVVEVETPDADPVARIAPDPACKKGVPAGTEVILSGAPSTDDWGIVSSYTWQFEDGSSATTRKPEFPHIFPKAGLSRFTLTVEDASGHHASVTGTCRVR